MTEGDPPSSSEPGEQPPRCDPSWLDETLFQELYGQLRQLARAHMARQSDGHTLQPTALVNEVYLRLRRKGAIPDDQHHFFRLVSRVMRQVLIDHARQRDTLKRATPGERIDLDELVLRFEERGGDLLELEAGLAALERRDPEMAQLVELRFFGGRSVKEVSEIMGIPERTIGRHWLIAKKFLRRELES